MKIICSSNITPDNDWSDYLKVGNVYTVIELIVNNTKDEPVSYRILNLDDIPAIYPSSLFSISDDKVNPNWIIHKFSSFYFKFTYKPFTKIDYWNNYFDDKTEEVEIFKQLIGNE